MAERSTAAAEAAALRVHTAFMDAHAVEMKRARGAGKRVADEGETRIEETFGKQTFQLRRGHVLGRGAGPVSLPARNEATIQQRGRTKPPGQIIFDAGARAFRNMRKIQQLSGILKDRHRSNTDRRTGAVKPFLHAAMALWGGTSDIFPFCVFSCTCHKSVT